MLNVQLNREKAVGGSTGLGYTGYLTARDSPGRRTSAKRPSTSSQRPLAPAQRPRPGGEDLPRCVCRWGLGKSRLFRNGLGLGSTTSMSLFPLISGSLRAIIVAVVSDGGC